jgi:hypothetical protein
MQRENKKDVKKKSGRENGFRGRSMMPMQYKSNPTACRKFRFGTVQGSSTIGVCSVYRNCMLSLIAMDSSTSSLTSVAFLISSIRLMRLKVWDLGDPDNIGQFSNVSVMFFSQTGRNEEYTATGNYVTPAHLSLKPPENSLANNWSLANQLESDLLFQINTTTTNVVVDIEVEYTYDSGALSFGTTGAGLAVATLGYCDLDSLNAAGSGIGTFNLRPIANKRIGLTSRTGVSPTIN